MEPLTYILYEGKPYRLWKISPIVTANPCNVCDLAFICQDSQFVSLCQPDGYDTSWAFIEDWNIIDEKVLDLLEINIK